ncbi:MAG: tRNA 4-thiouridine(8) synthase ThiI, partial [Deltaproteobacteria bacterium]|nr:tRNA 4-thiouridine(8) synthase ThiI [Deltaproteobacteria bacterium]
MPRRSGAQDPRSQLAILRFSGELSIKARATRYRFTQRLLQNLRNALESQGIEPEIKVSHDRIFVELPEGTREDVLTRVFGIQSISCAERYAVTGLADIVRHGEALFRERVRGKLFAVRARRVGNRHPGDVRSADVMRELGSALLPVSAGVDLGHPDVTVHLEMMGNEAWFFSERVPAQGGLPLGVEGRAVALVSGGFDSAVAAWYLLRRGVSLDYVFCNLGGATHQLGTLRVTKVVADQWSYGDRPRFHTVEFGPLVEELKTRTSSRYWQILLKRLMLRAAERIA